MNSALKPALGGAGVPAGGQASPAKGNVASNHAAAAVALPQGAQNHSSSLVGQNLSQHAALHHAPPHAVPPMAPVSANMAQMAQNMSNHGNLSHLNQNSAVPANLSAVASPSKAASTSSPLSLVQDKVPNASQPLALTRTPEKKEPDSTGHANGTIDLPKSGANAPAALKPQNPEPNKDKQDIAKTSPSTPKPPEKPSTAPSTPQKPEAASLASQASEGPSQPKVATANEPPEKSPSKPAEPTPAPTADVAPSQSNSKPVPESANNQPATQPPSQPSPLVKAPTLVKQDAPTESAKPESAKTEPPKVEEKKEAPEKPSATEDKKEAIKPLEPKKEDQVDGNKTESKPQPPKVEEKVVEEKKEIKKVETKPKSTLKLATVTPPMRKRRQTSPPKTGEGPPAKKAAEGDSTPTAESRTKRNRTKVQLYQSPTPELTMATKLSASAGRATPTKPNDDKLIVFYKNEYLAVRNAEGGFYVCQAMQNVYRSTRKIKIRWLSQDKAADPQGETYKPDFYDVTDMECVLTTLSLQRAGAGGAQLLKAAERARATSILQRALRAEQSGGGSLDLTPEHPDGLDLSLYTAESQLDNKSRKRRATQDKLSASPDTAKEPTTPAKKARTSPKRSPKSSRKAKTPAKQTNNNKRKPAGSTPPVASTSKTATAVVEKTKASVKSTPTKRTPVKKQETPVVTPARGRRAAKDSKPSPIVATPSTSTGKTTRTPRKPPSRK